MAAGAIALTTITGGINRLRVKGGADKNSLHDLLNGYVTQSNTVKVREGTFRNANIATYSGAGTTKGLLAYQSQLHVFSGSAVSVPPGYALHVLNHPARNQQITGTGPGTQALTLTWGVSSTGGLATPIGGQNLLSGEGFSLSPPNVHPMGSVSVAGFADGTQIAGLFSTGTNVAVIFTGFLGSGYFTSVGFTDNNTGNPVTLTTAAAAHFDNTTYPGYSIWVWSSTAALGAGSHGATIPCSFAGVQVTTTGAPLLIPIKEIHFSAPFLGGIYVVAEFNVLDPVLLATYGSVFHYWIQSSTGGDNANEWSASTDFTIGQVVIPTTPNGLTYIASRRLAANPLWTPNTAEVVGNIVEPNTANSFQYTVTAVLGATPTTGATEPTWPTTDGGIVMEDSSLASDQTVTLAGSADTTTTPPPVPSRYSNGLAGGFVIPPSDIST